MSKKRFELLSEAQWELIEPLLPAPKRRKDKRGRPWASNRACLEGMLPQEDRHPLHRDVLAFTSVDGSELTIDYGNLHDVFLVSFC
ncbi:transposase [Terracidiphilus sp.]|jgi:hypothetical protein|uniref:transposase n=1 Tax=Terracidiphilus sp. TaxID=1964191 RepID=UPI003C1D9C76